MLDAPCADRGESYHLSGFCLHVAVCNAPDVTALFLPEDGSCQLLVVDCAWDAEQTQTAFIVLFPVTAENAERLTPREGGTFGCSATYVGTLLRDGEAVPAFMHN